MSHQPERKEKDCLNCGTVTHGRYCHYCGQENIVIKQGFWSLTKHFVYDIFHFDGKFFDTLRYLILKPGMVPKEFILGRRMSYLDPIRMYLFTSAVFFLIFFSVRDVSGIIKGEQGNLSRAERFKEASELSGMLKNNFDSAGFYKLNLLLDTSKSLNLDAIELKDKNDSFYIHVRNKHYHIIPQSDTAEIFKADENESWFERTIEKKWKEKKKKYGDDERQVVSEFISEFMHKVPYLLFLSLPFFALILKLLYIRRKNYYYSDHAVFTLYYYILVFILLLFYFAFDAMASASGLSVFNWIAVLIMIWSPIYLLFALKRFYQQKWLKTFFKFLLLNFLVSNVMLILFIVFILLSLIL